MIPRANLLIGLKKTIDVSDLKPHRQITCVATWDRLTTFLMGHETVKGSKKNFKN